MALCERCQAEVRGDRPRFPVEELKRRVTLHQARMLDVLYARRVREGGEDNRWVTADTFRALLYRHKPDDPPGNILFSVYVVGLRQALRGSRWCIESGPYGTSSYRLVEGGS